MEWMSAWVGGVLIGCAALLLYVASGRIAGISGIAFAGLFGPPGERAWRLFFLCGLIAGAWAAVMAGMTKPIASLGADGFAVGITIMAGLLVGIGTRVGNGCTSGHGVCGLARLSVRSLCAVLLFMGAGIATASLARPWLVGVLS